MNINSFLLFRCKPLHSHWKLKKNLLILISTPCKAYNIWFMTWSKARAKSCPFWMMASIVLGQKFHVWEWDRRIIFIFHFELRKKPEVFLSLQKLRMIEVALAEMDLFACCYRGNSMQWYKLFFIMLIIVSFFWSVCAFIHVSL